METLPHFGGIISPLVVERIEDAVFLVLKFFVEERSREDDVTIDMWGVGAGVGLAALVLDGEVMVMRGLGSVGGEGDFF